MLSISIGLIQNRVPLSRIVPWSGNNSSVTNQPVELEVGFGKGMYLVRAAVEHPERNYFGIEIVRKYQLYAVTRIAKRKLPNAITAAADAKLVLKEHVPPSSLHAVHVYFPDPWWKARHKKRLLFTDDFADMVIRVLMPGGMLHFVTDVQDYFEMVTELLSTKPKLNLIRFPETEAPRHDMGLSHQLRAEIPIGKAVRFIARNISWPTPIPIEKSRSTVETLCRLIWSAFHSCSPLAIDASDRSSILLRGVLIPAAVLGAVSSRS